MTRAIYSEGCFICGELCTGNKNQYNSTAFKMLMRYLVVDKGTFSSEYCYFDSKISFCDKCDSKINGFWDLYRDMEEVRMFQDKFLHKLVILMKSSVPCQSEGGEDLKALAEDNLRTKIIEKCSARICSKPRVILGLINTRKVSLRQMPTSKRVSKKNNDEYNTNEDEDSDDTKSSDDNEWQQSSSSESKCSEIENIQSTNTNHSAKKSSYYFSTGPSLRTTPPSVIKSSSSRSCLLCVKVLVEENQLHFNFTPLQMLFRYLELSSHSHPHSSKLVLFCDNKTGARTPLAVILCEECSSRLNEFQQLYQDSEATRLSLDYCVQNLHDIMKQNNCDLDHSKEYQSVEKLRVEIMKKCVNKIRLYPQVSLKMPIVRDAPLPQPYSESYNDEDCKPFSDQNSSTIRIQNVHSVQNPQQKRKSFKYSCDYCYYGYSDSSNIRIHSMLVHPLQIFSKQLPPSTTESQLEEAIVETIKKTFPLRETTSNTDPEENEYFPCGFCGKKLTKRGQIRVHLLQHHFDKIVTILKETILFKSSSPSESIPMDFKVEVGDYKIHYQENTHCEKPTSSAKKVVKKSIPITELPAQNILDRVTRAFSAPVFSRIFRCYHCDPPEFFETYGKLLHHKRSIHQQFHSKIGSTTEQDKVPCEYCQKLVSAKKQLWFHMLRFHIMDLYSNTIPPGTTEPELQAATTRVMSKLKKTPEGKLGCPCCPLKVRSKHPTDLRLHIQSKHFDVVIVSLENPHGDIPESVMIQAHLPKLSGKDESVMTQKCPHCEKEIGANLFSKHVRRHAAKKTCIKCSLCPHSSYQLDKYRDHLIRKHTMTAYANELPPGTTLSQLENCVKSLMVKESKNVFRCLECGKLIDIPSDLRLHILKMHLKPLVEKLEKNDIPEESLATSSKDEENPYKCPKCSKAFKTKKYMKTHLKRHKYNQKIVCRHCEFKFSSKANRRVHMISRHPLIFFKSKIPQGTTEKELEAAIGKIISKGKTVIKDGIKLITCPHCTSSGNRKSLLKRHILRSHCEDVIRILEDEAE